MSIGFENSRSQLKSFKESLPEGFRSTIKKLAVTIESKIKPGSNVTTLSCCLHILFIYSVLNLKIYFDVF